MKILFIIATALAVSVDSLACGFSLSLNNKKSLPVAVCVSLTVLIMCYAAFIFGDYLKNVLTERTANVGGFILILVGAFNLISLKKQSNEPKNPLKNAVAVGFAVGLDGAAAELSLVVLGYGSAWIPLLIAFTHFLAVEVGIMLSSRKITGAIGKIDYAAPLILILAGLYKVLRLVI